MIHSFVTQSHYHYIPSKIEEKCRAIERKLEPMLQKTIEELNKMSSQAIYQDLLAKITAMLADYNAKMQNIQYGKSNQSHYDVLLYDALEREAYGLLKNIFKEVQDVAKYLNISIEQPTAGEQIAQQIKDIKNKITQLKLRQQERIDESLAKTLEKKIQKLNGKISKLQRKHEKFTVQGRLKSSVNPTSYMSSLSENFQYFFTDKLDAAALDKIEQKISEINNNIDSLQQKIDTAKSTSTTLSDYHLLQKWHDKQEALSAKLNHLIEMRNSAEKLKQRSTLQKVGETIVEKVASKTHQVVTDIVSAIGSTYTMYEKIATYMRDLPLAFSELDSVIKQCAQAIKELNEEILASQGDNTEINSLYIIRNHESLQLLKTIHKELVVIKDILQQQFANKENPVLNLNSLAAEIETQINDLKQAVALKTQFKLDLGFEKLHLSYLERALDIIQRSIDSIVSPLPSDEVKNLFNEMLDSYSNNFSRVLKLASALADEDEQAIPDKLEEEVKSEPASKFDLAVSFYKDEMIKEYGLNVQKHVEVSKHAKKFAKDIGKAVAGSSSFVLFGEEGDIKLQKILDSSQTYHPLNSRAKAKADGIYEAMDISEKLLVETASVAGAHLSNSAIDYAALTFASAAVVATGTSLLPAVIGLGVSFVAKGAVGYLKSNVEDVIKDSIKSVYISLRYCGINEHNFAIQKINQQLDKVRMAMLNLNNTSFSAVEKEIRLTYLIEQVLMLEQKVLDVSMSESYKNIKEIRGGMKKIDNQIVAINQMHISESERTKQLQMHHLQKDKLLEQQNEKLNFIRLMKSQKKIKEIEMIITNCQRRIMVTDYTTASTEQKQMTVNFNRAMINQLSQHKQNEFNDYQQILYLCMQNQVVPNLSKEASASHSTLEQDSSTRKRKAALTSAYQRSNDEPIAKKHQTNREVQEELKNERTLKK
ncbi:hypothetical protein [Candidatus Berkiella aquae]|uniref:Uncharacterized protein n=1 Tax=Candidatus Berkiella aquae TaxID=295108 RepID=A0A0Q9YX86_9GAMM|nr:hypothetical protein [Candidatus Berkiella aquae]MCS5711518.1 hypothetical protein [Candidatus Berkiella aquae]